jgi:two-component system, cell cycle response regulator
MAAPTGAGRYKWKINQMVGAFRQKTRSLSGHITVYLTGMLLLILFLLGTAWLTLKSTINDYNALADREFIEIRRLVYLRDTTLASVEPIYRYLAWGNPDESGLFEHRVEEVEQAFDDVLLLPSVTAEQRALLAITRGEWLAAVNVGRAIFMISNQTPVDGEDLIVASEMFQNHITTATNTLYEAHNIRISAITQLRDEINERHQLMGIIMAACFGGALLIFAVASFTMARHVFRPLRQLGDGINRYGQGELSHRIEIDTRNELGELAHGINLMAERLERDQIELEDLAIRDSLTNLYNRREFERLLEEEMHRALRYEHPLSMLLIDIDKFKEINDNLGHRAGDHALQLVAAVIAGISRKGDIISRYGGDELATLLPETPIEDAMSLAERIRSQVSRQQLMADDGENIALSLSIGVATTSDTINSGEELVDAADRAMYLAKTGGRNRVRRNESGGSELPKAMP